MRKIRTSKPLLQTRSVEEPHTAAAARRYAVGCAETATQLRRLAGRAVRPVAACVLRCAFRFLRRGHRRAFLRHW